MIKHLALAALLLPLECLGKNVADNSIYKLDFIVHRGNSPQDRGIGRKAVLRKRDFTMEIENEQTYYQAELEIGSQKDVNQVLVDTGSSDLWVISADTNCEISLNSKRDLDNSHKGYRRGVIIHNRDELEGGESNDVDLVDEYLQHKVHHSGIGQEGPAATGTCTALGSFSTSDSDTFHRNDSAPAFLIQYADNSGASGVWGYDTVRVGNISVSDFSFAVANVTSSDIGVLGIGLPYGEVTFALNYGGSKLYTYENFPMKLKSEGYIDKVAFSIYLNDTNSNTGSVLFGAVDHAKYTGDLETVPMVNTYQNYPGPPNIQVVLDSVSFNASGKVTTMTDASNYTILDTGSTLSYFPDDVLASIASQLGGTMTPYLYYLVPCPSGLDNYIIFNFSGKEILVPYESMLVSGQTSKECYLGIIPSDQMLLGDNFLRNAYIVMDYEDLEVSFAQAKYTDDEDIEAISSSVPNAARASDYSSTSLAPGSTDDSSISYLTGSSSSSSSKKSSGAHSVYANVYVIGFITFIGLVLVV